MFNLHFKKVSTENDNNFGYEKITILVDNILLRICVFILLLLGGIKELCKIGQLNLDRVLRYCIDLLYRS